MEHLLVEGMVMSVSSLFIYTSSSSSVWFEFETWSAVAAREGGASSADGDGEGCLFDFCVLNLGLGLVLGLRFGGGDDDSFMTGGSSAFTLTWFSGELPFVFPDGSSSRWLDSGGIVGNSHWSLGTTGKANRVCQPVIFILRRFYSFVWCKKRSYVKTMRRKQTF